MEEPLREFLKNDEEAQEIWDMSLKLEGIVRGTGKHAGGVVIAPTKLTDFSPIACDEEGGGLVTQFDKDDVEPVSYTHLDVYKRQAWVPVSISVIRSARPRA